VVVDIVDSASGYVQEAVRSTAMGLTSRVVAAMNWRIREFEAAVIQRADTTLINSDPDRAHLLDLTPDADVRVLPNCVPESLLARNWHAHPGRRFLSVGDLAYPPYRAGVSNFVLKVFPLIRNQIPDAELLIAGPHAALVQSVVSRQPGVKLLGYVPDLLALYESANALITPHTVVMGLQY